MIFSSAHTETQDRMASSSTSIAHLCPSWHNITRRPGVCVRARAKVCKCVGEVGEPQVSVSQITHRPQTRCSCWKKKKSFPGGRTSVSLAARETQEEEKEKPSKNKPALDRLNLVPVDGRTPLSSFFIFSSSPPRAASSHAERRPRASLKVRRSLRERGGHAGCWQLFTSASPAEALKVFSHSPAQTAGSRASRSGLLRQGFAGRGSAVLPAARPHIRRPSRDSAKIGRHIWFARAVARGRVSLLSSPLKKNKGGKHAEKKPKTSVF